MRVYKTYQVFQVFKLLFYLLINPMFFGYVNKNSFINRLKRIMEIVR
jgi:hypothetical protein